MPLKSLINRCFYVVDVKGSLFSHSKKIKKCIPIRKTYINKSCILNLRVTNSTQLCLWPRKTQPSDMLQAETFSSSQASTMEKFRQCIAIDLTPI